MKKHEADTTMNRHGWRDEPLEIEVGGLYEVWLQHDWEEPKPCVTVIPTSAGTNFRRWEVLVDGQVKDVYAGQIFRSGTATWPEPPFVMPIIKKDVIGKIARLHHDGVSRSFGIGSAVPRAWCVLCAGQHLGRWFGLQCL